MMVVLALTLPSLVALVIEILMPATDHPTENLMPGIGEAMLLAICIPLTTLSAMTWLIRRRRSTSH